MADTERPSWMPENWVPPATTNTRKRAHKKPPLEVPRRDNREEDFSKSPDEEEEVEVTRELVMNSVICIFQGLATLVDESFSVLDNDLKPLPHAEEAVTQMMPWLKIYG